MGVKNFVSANVLAQVDAATLGSGYVAFGTGLANPAFLIRIINDSNVDIVISYDGTNDHDYIIAGDTLQIAFQTNKQPNNFVALLKQGTIVYVEAAAGGAGIGMISLASYYQS